MIHFLSSMDSLQHLLARDEIYQERVRKIQTHRNRIQNLQNQRTREQQELNELRSMQLNPETTRELRRLEQNVPALAYMIDINEMLIREEQRGMMRRRMELQEMRDAARVLSSLASSEPNKRKFGTSAPYIVSVKTQ